MNLDEARRAIREATAQLPANFNAGGFWYRAHTEPEKQRAMETRYREMMADDDFIRMVATSLDFIDACEIIKTPSLSSYQLKHEAERWGRRTGREPYIINGAFIMAAIFRAVPYRHRPGHYAAELALSKRSVEAMRAQKATR